MPSTLGANAGLTSLPFMMQGRVLAETDPIVPIPRSYAWIAVGAVGSLLFIFVLGRGLTNS